jgi:hypothetical protein
MSEKDEKMKEDKIKRFCHFCKELVPHLVVTMDREGKIHVHAPFENRYLMAQFMDAIVDEAKKHKEE